MTYTLAYERRVVKEDIPRLGSNKKRVSEAVLSKLSSRPEVFGCALAGQLKGFYKLRVGPYRVIFLIEGEFVRIFKIGHRSSVYKEVMERVKHRWLV